MRLALKILLVAGALSVTWQVGQSGRSENPVKASVDAPPLHPNTGPRTGPFRGLAIQLHGGPGLYEAYHRLIPEVAELGADTILFVVHGWQTHGGSLDLHIDAQKTANRKDLGRLLDLAASYGLRRVLMPMVLLSHPRDGEWRGKIIPPGHDWDAWFKRYRVFINYFADIAERRKVELFMVGSELIKSEAYTQRWRDTIQEVRQHYRGKLGYSANWDHYQTEKIGFWSDLDYIGMTTYYELAKQPNPSIEEINSNWAVIKREIKAFQRKIRKPILFTEVGWCSQEGAAHEGWNYYANQKATPAGQREQTLLYRSFLKTWADEPGIGGIIWWEWDTTPGGKDDYGYTPRGKMAETVLRTWFAGTSSAPLVDKKAMTSANRDE